MFGCRNMVQSMDVLHEGIHTIFYTLHLMKVVHPLQVSVMILEHNTTDFEVSD